MASECSVENSIANLALSTASCNVCSLSASNARHSGLDKRQIIILIINIGNGHFYWF